MPRRQLVRVVAVAVAAVLLGVLGYAAASGEDPVRPTSADAGDGDYAAVVADLQSVLTAYAPLQAVTDHDQVHELGRELGGLELALAEVEEQARALGTADAAAVADLAAFVRTRAVQVRLQAAADHTDLGGVGVVQAFGREAALRAVSLGAALEAASEDGYGPVVESVAAPWPPPPEEGLGEPPTEQ